MSLRKTYKNHDKSLKRASKLKKLLTKNFDQQKLYDGFVEQIVPLQEMKKIDAEIDDLLSDLL